MILKVESILRDIGSADLTQPPEKPVQEGCCDLDRCWQAGQGGVVASRSDSW